MNEVYRITGYDKRSERLEIEHDIPADQVLAVRQLVRMPAEGEGMLGAYHLDPGTARTIARHLDKTLNLDTYDWYLEPFAD